MKNKKAQIPYLNEILGLIFVLMILSAFTPLFASLFNQSCPTCDCSSYQNQLDSCKQDLTDSEVKVVYINNTIEVPVIEEKVVYRDFPVSMGFISISFLISFLITLFSFEIKLPKRLEEKLERLENIITIIKFGSLALTTIIFIRLIMILLPLL